ncbi:MAG: O-antigen ligase family protein [Colwellia sp.]
MIEVNAELRIMLSTWFSLVFTVLFFRRAENINIDVISIVFWVAISYFSIKLMVAIVGVLSGSGSSVIHELMFNVTSPVWEIAPGIDRIQYINDLTVMLLFFLCGHKLILSKKINVTTFQVLAVVCFLALVISYSRLLFLMFFVLLVLVLKDVNKFSFVRFSLFGLSVSVCFIAFDVELVVSIVDAIAFRFDSGFNFESDIIRVLQFNALINMWLDAPFFGHGIGAYSIEFLRGGEAGRHFLYEMQWLSLLMKFGLVGIFLIILSLLYYIRAQGKGAMKENFIPFVTLLFFVFSSFTNPYLFSSSSGVFVALAVCVFSRRESLKRLC